MAVADVLRVLRDMKREGFIQDYILYGSVAAMVHTRPFYTDVHALFGEAMVAAA